MIYLLGVDGGGTKTHLALATEDGKMVAHVSAEYSNLHSGTPVHIAAHLRAGWKALLKQAGLTSSIQIYSCVAGLAGLDSAADMKQARLVVRKAFGKSLSKARVRIVNDAIIGFHSGSRDGAGVCVIGGTGSNCYGRNARGREAWAGGLGHILADEGSGYDIGLRALMAAAKAADGRGPKTKLLPLILKRYKVKTMRDLVPVVYAPEYGKHEIGQLAFDVQTAAAAGDSVARGISVDAAYELALSALTVGKKLFKRQDRFDVVMIGGVLQHDPILKREFTRLVKMSFPKVKFVIPKQPPVMGAIRLAMK